MDLKGKNVIFRAPTASGSGYGVHSRQIAVMLDKLAQKHNWNLFFQITPWGQTPFLLRDYPEKDLVVKYNKPYNLNVKPDISVQLILPNEWETDLAHFNIGITAGVETDRCNPKWIEACNKMDMVIVPTAHIKKTFENTGGLNKEILVLGESYNPDVYKKNLKCKLDLDFDTDWNFLSIGQITGDLETDRKNLGKSIIWFCEAFKGRKDVGLVLKTNSATNSKIDKMLTTGNLKNLLAQVRGGSEYPRVHLVHGSMTETEIAQLYKHPKIKAFFMPTRGEGFGLPILEAAVSGLPLVVTDWSGHKDIIDLTSKSCVRLSYNLMPLKKFDDNIFVKGAQWAEVNPEDAKRKLRKIVESYSVPAEWASELQGMARKKFHPTKLYKEFEKIIEGA